MTLARHFSPLRLTWASILLMSSLAHSEPLVAPFSAEDFSKMGVTQAWKKYGDVLTWGKGQCLAVLDDGCDLKVPEWQTRLPWGPKVIATYNSIDHNDNAAPVPPGYHGTTAGYPSSVNYGDKKGIAYNDNVAQVRCVTIAHLPKDESATMADALRWVLQNREKYNITAVNLSPLDDQRHAETIASAIDEPLKQLRDLGVWVSAPCGNNGYANGISWPAVAKDCYGIGATDPATDKPHLDRGPRTAIMAPATMTSSANAYLVASAMVMREAIEKAGYDWKKDGPNLADATLAIFKKTGADANDIATGLSYKRVNLLKALDYVFKNGSHPTAGPVPAAKRLSPSEVKWDADYNGDALTASPWLLTDNGTAPSSRFTSDAGAITIGTGSESAWAEQSHKTDGSLWNAQAGEGTVEMTFRIKKQAAAGCSTALRIDTGAALWDILISANSIRVNGATMGVTQTGVTINTDQSYTLRATFDASGLDVYLDGEPLSMLQDLDGAASGGAMIDVQRFTSAVGEDAIATIEKVRWNNGLAMPPSP